MKKFSPKLALALTATALFLASCGKSEAPQAQNSTPESTQAATQVEQRQPQTTLGIPEGVKLAEKQELTRVLTSFPDTIDPNLYSDNVSGRASRPLLDGLFRLYRNGEVEPLAAESYTVSEDGLTWTINLRKNATWQDGKPVTAADFVYSWQRLTNPETGSAYGDYLATANVVNAAEVNQGKLPVDKLGVEAKDDYTLVVHLNQPTPWLKQMLAYDATSPVRKDLIEKYGNAWVKPENFIGNGPYKLVKYAVNDEIVYEKWNDYWDAANVHITKSNIVFVNDPVTIYNKYAAGEILTSGVPNSLKAKVLAERPQELVASPSLDVTFLNFQHKDPKLQDVRVRRAIALLTDSVFFVEKILPAGHPTSIFTPTFINEGQEGKEADYFTQPMEERRAEAYKLLSEAGYTKENPLKLTILRYQNKTLDKLAVALQAQWKEGSQGLLEVDFNTQEWKSYLDATVNHKFQVRFAGWGADYNQASTFTNILLCGSTNNYGDYCNEDYDKLIKEANISPDAAKRAALYAQANKILQDDMAVAPLYNQEAYMVVSPKLGGLNWNNNETYLRDYYIIDTNNGK